MSKKDEITINFKEIKKKTAEYYHNLRKSKNLVKYVLPAVLVLMLMFFAYDIRAQAYTLEYVDDIAMNFIENNYKQQIENQIRSQNPALSSSVVRDRVESEYRTYYRQNREIIDNDARQLSSQLKQNYIGPDGEPYILDIDSHYWWQLTRQYLETGYVYDTVLDNGTMRDTYQLAPIGRTMGTSYELHPVYVAWTYKLTSWFTGWTAYKTFNLMPALVAMLVVIPAFFIGKMFGGNIAGLLSGGIMAFHPSYVSRSVAGYSSTDGYNVLLPLMIIWMVLLAFDVKDLWKKITFAGLAGFFVGVFSRSWGAWWFTFVIVLASIIGYIAFYVLKKLIRKDYKNWNDFMAPGIITGTVLLSSALFVGLFSGWRAIFEAPLRLLTRGGTGIGIQDAIGQGLWPNVLTTVAELSRPSTLQIISNVGGPIIFILAMIGIILSLLPLKNWRKQDYIIFFTGLLFAFLATTTLPMDIARTQGIDYSITFTALIALPILAGFINLLFSKYDVNLMFAALASAFFIATLFTTTQGVRFTLLLVPALAIALAVTSGRIIAVGREFFDKKKWNADVVYIAVFILVLVIFMPIVQAGIQTGHQRVPGISDGWHEALNKIRNETPQDTILTSWWDFGHWFKAIGDRRVTFDGTTQSTPMAHWVGKALLTNDEELSVGILRMLACGSRKGFDTLGENMHGVSDVNELSSRQFLESYRAINTAMLMDTFQAITFYEELGMSQEEAQEVANLTHCSAPTVIFLTSNDMIGKAPVWGHFGAWDFEKAYVANIARGTRDSQVAIQDIVETLDVSEQRARELFFEARQLTSQRQISEFISPRPNYLTTSPVNCVDEPDRIICQTNIGVGRAQGAVNVLSGIEINKTNVSQSRFIITVIEEATNEVVTRTSARPEGVILEGERTPISNPGLMVDVIIEYVNGEPKAIIATGELADSMFTRLYFWRGEGLDRFELFGEHSNDFAGHRTLNWQVIW